MADPTKPKPLTEKQLKELTEAQEQVSIKSQKHLEQWALKEAPFIIFMGPDLVRGLPWPDGHKTFQHLVMAYKSQRVGEADDERPIRHYTDPVTRETIDVLGRKTDALTVEELGQLSVFVGLLARRVVEHALQAEVESAQKNNRQDRLQIIQEGKGVIESGLKEVAGRAEDYAAALRSLRTDMKAIAELISD